MNKNSLPGEGKLFVVPRTFIPSNPGPEKARVRLLRLTDMVLLSLALIFVAVTGLAAYLFLCGDRENARDFLCICLPLVAALLGAASAAHLRS